MAFCGFTCHSGVDVTSCVVRGAGKANSRFKRCLKVTTGLSHARSACGCLWKMLLTTPLMRDGVCVGVAVHLSIEMKLHIETLLKVLQVGNIELLAF